MIDVKKLQIDQKIMVKGMGNEVFVVRGIDAIANSALVTGDWSGVGIGEGTQWVNSGELIETVLVPAGKFTMSTEQIKNMLNDVIGRCYNASHISGDTNKIATIDVTRIIKNVSSQNNIKI